MFCNQCEQTSKGKACTRLGICGKNEAVAIQQDKLVWQLRELAAVALMARDAGIVDTATDDFAFKALFSTLTNVNFDPVSLRAVQEECLERTTALAARVPGAPSPTPLAALDLRDTAIDRLSDDEDVRSAMQILLYGLKGVAAYADHAAELGQRDPDVAAFLYRGLRAGTGLDPESRDLNGWLGLVLECVKANLRAMELLEAGNTGTFGTPVPTPVSLGRRKGKAILVSGHDLPDLLALLEGQRYRPVYHNPRRDAARPRLSRAACLPASGRALRHGLAEPAEGTARLPRRGALHHQLHPGSQGLCRQGLHLRQCVLARPGPLQGP